MLNLIAVQKKLKLKHQHPLTELLLNGDESPCNICKQPGYDAKCKFKADAPAFELISNLYSW